MDGGLKIAVVGCGPGGLASALFLHRAGHSVTLFDQFATPQPLGSGLLIQPSGQHVLNRLGLLDTIREKSATVRRLSGTNVLSGKRALDMEFGHLSNGAMALGIHRASLFDCLFDAVLKTEIPLHTGCVLADAKVGNGGVNLRFGSGIDFGVFDLMIDASGARSQLASGAEHILPFAAFWTTVDMPVGSTIADGALDQRYWAASKMAGIMPIGINPATGNQGAALFWSVKPENADAILDRCVEEWSAEFLALWPQAAPFVAQVKSTKVLTLAIYRHRTGRAVSQNRIFHIGDSWHCTSPQLGQGANMALIDAAAVAAAISFADRIEFVGHHYRHLRADHVLLYQWLSYIFTPLYQSDSKLLPTLRDLIIHNFAKVPLVRNLIARVVSGNLGNTFA
ncbi:MAG: NAD(P)/FAD-dependent oxidoreductase [Sphingorhabdus sp.]